MKKVLALLLAFVMVFSVLAACGPVEEDPKPTDPPATEAPTEEPDEPTEEPTEAPTDEPTDPEEPTEPEEDEYLTMMKMLSPAAHSSLVTEQTQEATSGQAGQTQLLTLS